MRPATPEPPSTGWVIVTLVAAFCVYLLCLPLTPAGRPNEAVPNVTEAPPAGVARSVH